ncbi:MAG: GAF domain-containing sensor histidine kinase [Anaerolineaceae bacterium]|nr:GAF domain-containing sensor histidine kinase [Anaerolineaceae bacterium]
MLALHEASLELVSDISLESLLERIAHIACEQVDAKYAAVGVIGSNGELEQFIPVGMSPQEIQQMDHTPRGLGIIGALMNSHNPIRISDLTNDPRSVGFPPYHPAMNSFLGIPIRLGEQQLGQIYITNKNNGVEFTVDDQMIIEMLSSYAAVAISNARLYKEFIERDKILSRRNENLALLNQLASTLAASPDIDQILDKALSQVLGYLRLEVGEIFLRQEDGISFKMMHHHGKLIDNLWKQDTYLLGEGMIGNTAKTRQARLMTILGSEDHDINPALLDKCFNQIACFPLSGRQGGLGVMCVATCHPQPLDDLEIQFLQAISSWVGTAIENARLSQQGKRLAILEERERIGMDLHDGIIQSIYAVGLTLEHARLLLKDDVAQAYPRIDQAIRDLNSTIRDIRTYILDLRPRQLHDEGLMPGIQRLINEFHANTLLETDLQGPSEGLENLPQPQAIALFHICQEALANIAKHAHAKRVNIVVWISPGRVLMEIHDDGRGFDTSRMRLSLGHGLSNMNTRARNVGGDVDITAEPGAGTTIMAWVPYKSVS